VGRDADSGPTAEAKVLAPTEVPGPAMISAPQLPKPIALPNLTGLRSRALDRGLVLVAVLTGPRPSTYVSILWPGGTASQPKPGVDAFTNFFTEDHFSGWGF
jgi:hypothetical protein